MLCPNCGKEVGSETRLCTGCRIAESESQVGGSRKKTSFPKLESQPGSFPSLATLSPEKKRPSFGRAVGTFLSCAALFYLAFVVVAKLSPASVPTNYRILFTMILFCLFLSLTAWLILWKTLFCESRFLALLALPVPPMVYTLLITDQDRAFRPFIVHFFALILSAVLFEVYIDASGQTFQQTLRWLFDMARTIRHEVGYY